MLSKSAVPKLCPLFILESKITHSVMPESFSSSQNQFKTIQI